MSNLRNHQHLIFLTSLPFWIYSLCILFADMKSTHIVNDTGFQTINIIDSNESEVVARSPKKLIMVWDPRTANESEIISPAQKKPKNKIRKSFREPTLPYNLIEETVGLHTIHTWHLNCSVAYANTNRLQQNHPCVLDLIRRFYLYPPTSREVPYKLDSPVGIDPSDGQSKAILRLLRNQTNGFFVECGALDGQFISNSLYMERSFNWSGILVEAGRESFDKLKTRNRKAYALSVCISPETYPIKNSHEIATSGEGCTNSHSLDQDETQEVASSSKEISDDDDDRKVQCFPLYSILLAVNRTQIDYLGIDVKGLELKVLLTIPWSKVDITTLSVRWNREPDIEAAITGFMERNGYIKFGSIESRNRYYLR